jgi:hypothetical protein
MQRPRRLFFGGSAGNEQLTAIAATLLLVLLALEGATLLRIDRLLTMHAFVGILLIPVVAVKLASTGWRMLRYYLGADEYVRLGPPHIVLRALVAPVTAVSTTLLFSTGVALLAVNQVQGPIVGLHRASFIVWLGAMTVHVLTRVGRLLQILRRGRPGMRVRVLIVTASLATGAFFATLTLPAADALQDQVTAYAAIDRDG